MTTKHTHSNTVGERVGKSQDTAEKDAEAEGERQTQVAIAEIETQARPAGE